MKIKIIGIAGLTAVLILLGIFILIPRISRDDFARLRSRGDLNVILITVDTLRADRIGCYGFRQVKTPTMDLFAVRGVKFNHCISQTPLTLPSHTTLMTGTYPLYHGVRDNGGFLVPPQLDTLAEVFKQADYQTAAFVASYVLDSKWGLNQGFDFYFDRFDLSKYKSISLGNVQRRGDEVMDEALSWLDSHKANKFFTWIHLYDPHTPYDPPSPFREQYSKRPYLGEIAFADSQLGRLWGYLETNGLVKNTVLVFAADHGESLSEHKESTHGFFVYQATVHVPLIVVTPLPKYQGLSRDSVVSLVDVMPTILEMAGLPLPSRIQGKSLIPLIAKNQEPKEPLAYTETYYPRFHYGWSELKSLQDDRFKLIMAPELELYDLDNDPQETHNLVSSRPEETRRLVNLANSFIERSSQNALEMDYKSMDEEARQKLAALGYIGTFSTAGSLKGRALGDPKKKISVFNQLSQAKELGLRGRYEEGIRLVDRIIADDPNVIDAYFTKGNLYFKAGQFKKAVTSFNHVLDRKPDDAFTAINIANAYISMRQFDKAGTFLEDIAQNIPPDSQIQYILGNIQFAQKKYEKAEQHYRKCMELNPSSASAYNALGGIFVIKNRLDEAKTYLDKALGRNPKLRNLHYNYALFYEAEGDLEKAESEYMAELENIPHSFRASFNLARIYRRQGRTDKEQQLLEKTIESNPRFPLSYFYLARIFLNRGERYKEAVDLVLKGIALKPEKKELPLGYFLLADLYNRLGDKGRSQSYAYKGRALADKLKHP